MLKTLPRPDIANNGHAMVQTNSLLFDSNKLNMQTKAEPDNTHGMETFTLRISPTTVPVTKVQATNSSSVAKSSETGLLDFFFRFAIVIHNVMLKSPAVAVEHICVAFEGDEGRVIVTLF